MNKKLELFANELCDYFERMLSSGLILDCNQNTILDYYQTLIKIAEERMKKNKIPKTNTSEQFIEKVIEEITRKEKSKPILRPASEKLEQINNKILELVYQSENQSNNSNETETIRPCLPNYDKIEKINNKIKELEIQTNSASFSQLEKPSSKIEAINKKIKEILRNEQNFMLSTNYQII